MSILYLLLPIGLLLSVMGVAWFVWAVRSGQLDDLETPAVRMLFDDEDLGARSSNAEGEEATDAPEEAGAPPAFDEERNDD